MIFHIQLSVSETENTAKLSTLEASSAAFQHQPPARRNAAPIPACFIS
jgi:hypothetical protein